MAARPASATRLQGPRAFASFAGTWHPQPLGDAGVHIGPMLPSAAVVVPASVPVVGPASVPGMTVPLSVVVVVPVSRGVVPVSVGGVPASGIVVQVFVPGTQIVWPVVSRPWHA